LTIPAEQWQGFRSVSMLVKLAFATVPELREKKHSNG
jgi:hypothetical protein